MRDFVVDDAVAHSLAAGRPDPDGTATLRRARLNRTLLILLAIERSHPERREALRIIAEAQQTDRAAVAHVLGYPWVGVWAARCLRSDGSRHLDYLDNVAGACRHRAVADGLRTVDRPTMLPTVGMLRPDGTLLAIRAADVGAHRLWVDDLDPYRDCHGLPPAARLSADEWRRWEVVIRDAWRLLRDHAGDWADDLAAGLCAITPLRPSRVRKGLSVTHGDAYGGFAGTRPERAADLAATMVHEFQHSKLNALLDLTPLQQDDADEAGPGYFAPWRADRRPLSGMIQGTSAFLAVARVWHCLRGDAALEADATRQFAFVRAQVVRAAEQIVDAPRLTTSGRRYVHELAEAARGLLETAVPAEVEAGARKAVGRIERRRAC
jgi:hypothetical protein